MKRMKKVVDERQEQELLKIEHIVFWIAFWALFVSYIVQAVFMDVPFQQYLPELVIFLICCVGILIGCVKKGQWGFFTRPTPKTYVISSAVGSVVFGLIYGIGMYTQYDAWHDQIGLLILTAAILTVFMFAVMYAVSAWVGRMVKNKQKKLADQYSDDEE